ncbi:MAG: four-helix bundle copper-binding protein [Candidatus Thiodiazotropha sp.]
MSSNDTLIDRREFLVGTAAALTMAAIPTTASAMQQHQHHHHHHGKHKGLVDAAEECVATGKTCLNHCLVLLGDGDTSMKECSKNVNEMIPVCEAMATLALSDSKNLKVIAQGCLAVCEDCAAACKEHIDKHQECKDCYEACKHSIKVVEAYLKAA